VSPKPAYCFILGWSFDVQGGVSEVVKNLIEEFREGREWDPIRLEAQWDPQSQAVEAGPTKHLYFRFRPPYEPKRPLRHSLAFLRHLPSDVKALRRIARDHNIAVFNPHFVGYGSVILVLMRRLRLYKGKVILSIHGTDIRQAHQATGAGRFWWRFLLRNADAVVACSDGLGQEVHILEPRARLVTVHNGINVERFRSNSDPNFKWPAEFAAKKVVINIGTFQHSKGQDILLRAFCEVLNRHPDTVLLLIGNPGPASEAIRQLKSELGLHDSVRILERVPHQQICGYLQHSSIFVMSSRWLKGQMGEGFPVVLLEAAAAGTPVVTTASTGAAELIEDGITGRLVPLDDSGALASAICDMLANPLYAARLADTLSKVVRERFTWRQAADKYSALASEG
jgi:glycosyltransferase involved in cell wall biosynthesis